MQGFPFNRLRAGVGALKPVTALLLLGGASLAVAQAGGGPAAADGARAYTVHCATCHGAELSGSANGTALSGELFLTSWGGRNAGELLKFMKTSMPPSGAGKLDDAIYAAIAEYVMARNGVEAEGKLAGANAQQLAEIALPLRPVGDSANAFEGRGVGGVTKRFPLPPEPKRPNRFAGYTPVTEAMLADPAPENWLTWRRSHAALGYSPLAQITSENVGKLRLAWSLALPAGPNMAEPLVRDGVLYTFGYGDQVLALDATDGHVLWHYRRQLPEGTVLSSKKSMALYGDKLFAATSDLHMVALDARTGKLVWDSEVTDNPGLRNPGGPLAADGVVMTGLTGQVPGGALIVGLDAETGKKLWTFHTIGQPGELGGDTWNGLALEDRSGGSSWTSGTYDAKSGLAFFGTGTTYDTGPMRDRKPGMNNDALFTDTTLAFEPRTGKLRWYFQHMKNDQWDLDWVFDRVIGTLEVGGKERRVVMTSGKEGLFDTLDAATGQYLKTVDMGIQNFVTAIDPKTGDKTIDPAMIPDGKTPILLCPHGGGGRNWGGTSFNQRTHTLYVVARDVCMDMVPAGEGGFLSTGVNVEYAPRPGSDGRYAVLQALDMQTGKKRWEMRQRAPFDTGVLTTAGNVLFVGSVDRQVMALDQDSGRELWRAGLSGTPNASPVSFAVDGRQYVAFVTGHGNPLSFGVQGLTPDIEMPPFSSSAIYVFALPEGE